MAKVKEVWKHLEINGKKSNLPYYVSNLGKLGLMEINGKVKVVINKIKDRNQRIKVRVKNKDLNASLGKLVATAFIKKESSKKTMVIHKDHDYTNTNAENLKWVTPAKHREHTNNSPASIKARKNKIITAKSFAKVLTEKQVKEIKTLIWSDKRKLTYQQIAERYGVSNMQIYRIKRGEIWFHVKVENEPESKKYKQHLSNLKRAK